MIIQSYDGPTKTVQIRLLDGKLFTYERVYKVEYVAKGEVTFVSVACANGTNHDFNASEVRSIKSKLSSNS